MQDGKYCYITGYTQGLDKHHVYGGPNRKNSDRYGCWVWLRHDIHMALHTTRPELQRQLKQECQEVFEQHYDRATFMRVFGRNYLEE